MISSWCSEKGIIHTVAHELAHYVTGKGATGLYEKEAEELLIEWGFDKEMEEAKYDRPISESLGYKIGYEWAKNQEEEILFSRFEEYYEEWDEENLSAKRYEELHYDVDPGSILHERDQPKEHKNTKGEVMEEVILDCNFIDKGIIWGIMTAVKEIKMKRDPTLESDIALSELIATLENINIELDKLFTLEAFRQKYLTEAQSLDIPSLSWKIEQLLRKVKEEAVEKKSN